MAPVENTWEVPRGEGSRTIATPGTSQQPVKERIPAATVAYVLRLRAELEDERRRVAERGEEVARLEGAQAMGDKVEAAVQRYADRLETKLDESRRREATLAREVGRLEGRAEKAEALLLEPPPRPGWFARLTSRKSVR